jgi:hypothetical protein
MSMKVQDKLFEQLQVCSGADQATQAISSAFVSDTVHSDACQLLPPPEAQRRQIAFDITEPLKCGAHQLRFVGGLHDEVGQPDTLLL